MRSKKDKIRRKISKLRMKFILRRKWNLDCRYLPLTAAHRELYDNIHRRYRKIFGKFPNLVDCQDLNEQIQWLKLFDQDQEVVRCINKITVRNYVQETVGDQYLVKLYQVHNHFDQIDFDALPDAFVIKANHDSGTVFLVRDKAQLDKPGLKLQIEAALRRPWGWKAGEWGYSYIPPQVLVEEMINSQDHEPPADYKFYCSEGEVKFMRYIYSKEGEREKLTINPDGNELKIKRSSSFKFGSSFNKPQQWNKMIDIAERLSKNFKYVRVDLFCTEEHIYVGELTFWPMAGYSTEDGQKILGSLINFDRTTYKPLLLPELEAECSRFNLYPSIKKQKTKPQCTESAQV